MKKSRNLLIFIVIFFVTTILINPQKYSKSILDGISLFVYNVLPTLFPLMIFSKLLEGLNFSNFLAKYTYKPINKIYHTSGYSSYIFVLSLFCGYPLTSKILADLYKSNKINKDEVLAISSFTSNSNPMFIIGTIGAIMLKNTNFALIILISHYTSSIINGIIYSTFKLKKSNNNFESINNNNKIDLLDIMQNTTNSLLVVLGYIAIFNLITDICIDYKIIDTLTMPFCSMYEKMHLPNTLPYYNTLSFIEITRGIKDLSVSNINPVILLPTICSNISFGGMCINLQCYSFMQNTGIRFSSFILTKITQAIFAYVICYFVCLIVL